MNTQIQWGRIPLTIISPALRRAKIHSLCHQPVIIALDGSLSMSDDNKADDASAALLGVVNELALPGNKDGFEIAVIRFSDRAEIIHPFEKASSLIGHLQPLKVDPEGNGTNITAALELTDTLLSNAAAQPSAQPIRQVQPLTVVMSDGMHNVGASPLSAATGLKRKSDILTVAFGADADMEMLRRIATEQLAVRCRTGADLRCYFAEIGRTLTVTRATGLSAAKLLSNP